MTPSDLPEQGDLADGRQWTIRRTHPMVTEFDGPRLALLESVRVVPLERAHRAEAEVKRLRKHFEGLNVARRGPMGALLEHYEERAERAEEAARDFAKAIRRDLDTFGYDNHEGLADALDRHPGFLPNDPGENG